MVKTIFISQAIQKQEAGLDSACGLQFVYPQSSISFQEASVKRRDEIIREIICTTAIFLQKQHLKTNEKLLFFALMNNYGWILKTI